MVTSAIVPNAFPVAIDGHEYLVDLEKFESASIESIRQQADNSPEFGEQSLNPLDLWRRSVDDWRFGSGQRWLDREDSDRPRFYTSSGITPWERGQVSLLELEQSVGAIFGPGRLLAVGDYLVGRHPTNARRMRWRHKDGTNTDTASDLDGDIQDFCTNGARVYVGTTASSYEIYGPTDTPTIPNSFPVNVSGIWFVMGRLIFAKTIDLFSVNGFAEDDVYTITPATLRSDDWTWTAAGSGGSFIYVAGSTGDGSESLIYRISIRPDGTNLSAPSVAAPLPSGEVCHSIYDYAGIVALGTSRGVRLASPASGWLEYGPVAETGSTVRCFEAFGKFLWFGRDGGIGRMDLSRFLPGEVLASPFVENDLDATGTTDPVTGLVYWDSKLHYKTDTTLFTHSTTQYVSEGTVRSGKLTFGLPDSKALEKLQVRCDPLPANTSIDWAVEADGVQVASGSITGTGSTGTDPEVAVGGTVCDVAEVILTLKTTDATVTPVLTRWTLRAHPIPRPGLQFSVPLILREDVTGLNGRRVQMDPEAEWTFLLDKLGEAVEFQEGSRTRRAYVDKVHRGPALSLTKNNDGFQGIATVVLRSFDE